MQISTSLLPNRFNQNALILEKKILDVRKSYEKKINESAEVSAIQVMNEENAKNDKNRRIGIENKQLSNGLDNKL
jgi:hypothetical protein